MSRQKLAFSLFLGTILTTGLLLAFVVDRSSAMAPAEAPETFDRTGSTDIVATEDTLNTGHVVVVLPGERAAVRSITWTGTISRVTALELADFEVEHLGDTPCSIEGYGCPTSECFCPDNWWSQGQWDHDAKMWNTASWPPPDVIDGDVIAFRYSRSSWGPPILPAQAYTGSLEGLEWLREQQQADGSFGSANYTAEALMAVSANSVDGSTWRTGPSLLASVLSNGADFANLNAAGAGKLAVALAAQESCWPIAATLPLNHYDPESGTFSPDTLYQAWGILGAATLDGTVPVSAVESLKENQQSNGGWELFVEFGSDTNTTALALQALISAGDPVTSTSVVSGLNYLENAQNEDGGFPYSPNSPYGTDSDTNSTAYVVQALFAAGEDPLSAPWAISNTNPVSYLLSMQLPNGSFEWQDGFGADQIATQQAIPALLHRPFPMMVNQLDSCYGVSGQVVGGIGYTENALKDVTVEAEGAGDLFFDITDAAGVYTISVPSTNTYVLRPSKEDFTFTPTSQSVEVSEAPGDITLVSDFAGATHVYLPLIVRD